MKPISTIIIIALSLFFHACTTRYYLVRHAERQCGDCATCGLTFPGGRDRALALSDSLFDEGIDTIFASECIRTQLTANPLAGRLHKTVSIYQTAQLDAFIRTLKSFHDSRDILIVGHSDQIPIIIDSLTHQQVVINGNDFDNLYIITKKTCFGTRIRLQSLKYGAP